MVKHNLIFCLFMALTASGQKLSPTLVVCVFRQLCSVCQMATVQMLVVTARGNLPLTSADNTMRDKAVEMSSNLLKSRLFLWVFLYFLSPL